MEILTIADFTCNYAKKLTNFVYPTEEGMFSAELFLMHWAPHAILHTLWILDNGTAIDCAVFRDSELWNIVQDLDYGDRATLTLEKASSGKIYLRKIEREN